MLAGRNRHMSISETPKLLVPVDVSVEDTPGGRLVDILPGVDVVLLGYFPVPAQSLPAQLKLTRGDEAATRLEAAAELMAGVDGVGTVETELIFTHDRLDPIDRIADQRDCDAVRVPDSGTASGVERILVPLRDDRNLDRIVSFAGAIARGSGASVTLFHAVTDGTDDGHELLAAATDRLVADGLTKSRVDREVTGAGDGDAEIVALAPAFDLIVLGETEPSLSERIFGTAPTAVAERADCPVTVVRDTTEGG
ncbi:universal stress protein [Halobacteriales archaeon QH_10_67_13]|nr:MAG: universal stress protein [Halobacteriales archaeon QH_10_67_13]